MSDPDLRAVVEKIEAAVREPGFIYTLSLILLRDVFMNPAEAADINWHDHLSFQEITFLIGLLVKGDLDFSIPSVKVSEKRFEQIYYLFIELHKCYGQHISDALASRIGKHVASSDIQKDFRETFGAAKVMIEPILYSGSGAYDFQYLEFAVGKYTNDEQWIAGNLGIDIPLAADIARELKKIHERKYRNLPAPRGDNFEEFCQATLSVFCFTEVDLSERFSASGVANFIDAFSLVPGKANEHLTEPGQYNELQARPIIRLADGRLFLPVGFNLAEAIYECPFFWMNRDPGHRERALRNRGDFAQEATARLLARVFGENNVYAGVRVERAKGRTITDIDVLAVAGNKAVIAQVKSKRLTELARLGDDRKLLADFKAGIQDAYDQALLSRRAVIDKANRLVIDGEELLLREKVDDAYILCVTLDHYPAVAHQSDVYLEKNPDDPAPITISVFDLDIIASYLGAPFEFLYYLRQRTKLSGYFKADSEMSLLGFHLKHKLFKHEEGDVEFLDNSFAQLIDANFPVLRGAVPATAAAQRLYATWKNEEFDQLIEHTKSAASAGFMDAVFFLYDLAGEGADNLIRFIKLVKNKTVRDGRPHDASLLNKGGRSGTTIMSEPSSPHLLERKLLSFARIRKYKSKADVWLGLGCLGSSPALVDAMVFSQDPWQRDEELEKIIAHFPNRGTARKASGRKVGRNEPCPCGSGKKFKRCHGA